VSLTAFTLLWAWFLMLRFTQLRTRSRMAWLAGRIALATAVASDPK
jgi:hypothetical protein